jgi:hypothetical protein
MPHADPVAGMASTRLFNNRDNLATLPLAGLEHDERGASVTQAPGLPRVWTGTRTGGTAEGHACRDWMTATGSFSDAGAVGFLGSVDGWTFGPMYDTCSTLLHLYCFED